MTLYRPDQSPTATPINLPTTTQLQEIQRVNTTQNPELAERSHDLIAQVNHIFYMLKVFGINTDQITTNSEYIKGTTELVDLIYEIKMAWLVIRQSLYNNLSTNKHGEIDRTPENIDSLRTNLKTAAGRLITISDSVPPFPIPKNDLTPPPDYPIDNYEDPSLIQPILEEMRQYLIDFITANRTRLLLETKATTLEFDSAVQALNLLEEDTLNVEPAADEAYSANLDAIWGPILTGLSSKLAEFDRELRDRYQTVAEQLLSYPDEKALETVVNDNSNNEAIIQKTIARRQTLSSFPAIKIFMEIYLSITGKTQRNWMADQEQKLQLSRNNASDLSNIVRQRRQVFGKRPR